MANAAGYGGGHVGPYWRRLLGITMPGERTQEELNQVNAQRQRLGLDPLGGPPTAQPGAPLQRPEPMDRTAQQGSDLESLRQMLHQGMLRQAQPAPFDATQARTQVQQGTYGQEPTGDHTFWQGLQPGQVQQPQEDLRQQLLDRLGPQQGPGPGRDALRRYVAQAQMKQATAGKARRPILPPRPGQRAAVPARPY